MMKNKGYDKRQKMLNECLKTIETDELGSKVPRKKDEEKKGKEIHAYTQTN